MNLSQLKHQFQQLTKRQKIILFLTIPIILIVFFFLFLSSSPSDQPLPTITPTTTPSSTISPTPSTIEFSYNTSDEWQQLYQQGLNEYEQTRNAEAEATLAYIRQHAPIEQDNFIIDYTYANNTYTITLLTTPYSTAKQQVLDWIQQENVPTSILNTLRLDWIEQ